MAKPPRVRILDQPDQWLRESDHALAQVILTWIVGPFVDEDIESTEIDEEGAPAYVSRVPETDIVVFWRAPANGSPQIYWIEALA